MTEAYLVALTATKLSVEHNNMFFAFQLHNVTKKSRYIYIFYIDSKWWMSYTHFYLLLLARAIFTTQRIFMKNKIYAVSILKAIWFRIVLIHLKNKLLFIFWLILVRLSRVKENFEKWALSYNNYTWSNHDSFAGVSCIQTIYNIGGREETIYNITLKTQSFFHRGLLGVEITTFIKSK